MVGVYREVGAAEGEVFHIFESLGESQYLSFSGCILGLGLLTEPAPHAADFPACLAAVEVGRAFAWASLLRHDVPDACLTLVCEEARGEVRVEEGDATFDLVGNLVSRSEEGIVGIFCPLLWCLWFQEVPQWVHDIGDCIGVGDLL